MAFHGRSRSVLDRRPPSGRSGFNRHVAENLRQVGLLCAGWLLNPRAWTCMPWKFREPLMPRVFNPRTAVSPARRSPPPPNLPARSRSNEVLMMNFRNHDCRARRRATFRITIPRRNCVLAWEARREPGCSGGGRTAAVSMGAGLGDQDGHSHEGGTLVGAQRRKCILTSLVLDLGSNPGRMIARTGWRSLRGIRNQDRRSFIVRPCSAGRPWPETSSARPASEGIRLRSPGSSYPRPVSPARRRCSATVDYRNPDSERSGRDWVLQVFAGAGHRGASAWMTSLPACRPLPG
jgi:hypothetical protein